MKTILIAIMLSVTAHAETISEKEFVALYVQQEYDSCVSEVMESLSLEDKERHVFLRSKTGFMCSTKIMFENNIYNKFL